MFLIVDNTQRKIRKVLKSKLSSLDLPVVLADLAHADLYMPCSLIIVTEKYLVKEVEYIASMYGKPPVVLWDDSIDFVEFVFGEYKRLYNKEVLVDFAYNLSIDGRFLVGNRRIVRISKTEKRILYFLLYNNGWYEKELVARYCLADGIKSIDSLPVHISNLNTKINKATVRNSNLIKTKRYVGYCIEENDKKTEVEISIDILI